MQETRYEDMPDALKDLLREHDDGVLVDYKDIISGKRTVKAALGDERNRSVSLHKPGEVVQLGCRRYKVADDGSWRRIEDAPRLPEEEKR